MALQSMQMLQQNLHNPEDEDNDEEGCFSDILELVSLLVAFPLFLYLSNILPNPDWVFNLDRILLFAVTFAVVYLIANTFVIITTWVCCLE